MPSQPPDAPCIVRDGETVEAVDDHWLMPDGSTRDSIEGCDISPTAILRVYVEDDPPPRPKAKPARRAEPLPTPATLAADPHQLTADPHQLEPVDVTPADDDQDTMAVVAALPPDPPRMPPAAAVNPVTVALAIGVAGTAGVLGWQALQGQSASSQQAEQRKEEERQREQCGTASDSVLLDFRARAADFRMRELAQPDDPGELWNRCDVLEARIEQLGQASRIRAKTRRA